MKLQNVFGNTYFVKGGTNTGLYLFENNEALLIDPGLNGLRPKNMIKMFENVKIMNINNVQSLEQVIKEVKENG